MSETDDDDSGDVDRDEEVDAAENSLFVWLNKRGAAAAAAAAAKYCWYIDEILLLFELFGLLVELLVCNWSWLLISCVR